MHTPLPRRRFLAASLLLAGGAAGCSAQQRAAQPAATVTQTATATVTSTQTVASSSNPAPEAYAGMVPQAFGTHLPGIVDTVPTVPGARTVALTFDACSGGYGAALIQVLREHNTPATLFLAQPWIEAHPDVTAELAADPLFQVENHGTRHVPLTVAGQPAYGIHGTASPAEALAEIQGNAGTLAEFGVRSRWFRAGTAHYDDIAVRIAHDAGMQIAGFSVNGDYGAASGAHAVAQEIVDAPDGAIVLAHMNHPGSGTAAGVRLALSQLPDVRFTLLDAP
ncbi:polysaccharide deacetylase family protein [Corynebacterium aquatimens]|uniref:polysaccharide deacetylase family protein n=1 Tax=Corynebacterium aquatimens TaxID=1190508 RepID=UPI00253FEBEE|nr:polysaccharide deacetylase family protein [Corynebacterium aquatimens]